MTRPELKYVVMMFQLEGHTTWHATMGKNVEQLTRATKGAKITKKKYFEIDRLTGTFEEF